MSQQAQRFAGWLVGIAVSAALAFGLMVALATPASALTCANDGWDWLGEQPSEQACVNACRAVHGDPEAGGIWNPTSHCCRCLY
jgi:hypothetical protein